MQAAVSLACHVEYICMLPACNNGSLLIAQLTYHIPMLMMWLTISTTISTAIHHTSVCFYSHFSTNHPCIFSLEELNCSGNAGSGLEP